MAEQQTETGANPPDRQAGLAWPEEYSGLQARIRAEWEVEGDIYLVRKLGGGKSGALVYVTDLTSRAFTGQAILKFDKVPQEDWSEAKEFERHRRAFEVEPDYAGRHLPQLVHALQHDDKIAQLSTVAGRGLEYATPWADCSYPQQMTLARRVSEGLLEDWNRHYRLAARLQDPQTLLKAWLAYRLDPEEGRIHRFLVDECGLAADQPSFIFEGQWYPNALAFTNKDLPSPEKLRLRAVTGQQHGDLNSWNVLAVARPGVKTTYHLIDLALYQNDQYLFYDHAYFELSYLLAMQGGIEAPHWQTILESLRRFQSAAPGSGSRAEDVGLLKMVSAVRREVLNWVDRHEPNRLPYLESQYLLARVAVGLNFTNKPLSHHTRCRAFTYAASNLKDYLQLHGLDWPKHGPAFELAGGAAPLSIRPVGGFSDPSAASASAHPPLPDKPSVAVLPFKNPGADPDQAYLADGITEEIATELARSDWLMVISRGSTFAYKEQGVDAKQVGRELGVHYVVEGSVRTAGQHVRVTVQLIDASSGHDIWAERYDRELKDIFVLQDEIAETISANIDSELKASERQHAQRKHPPYNAWDRYQRGLWHFFRQAADESKAAKDHILEAIKLEPGFAPAYGLLAILDTRRILLGWEEHPSKALEKALKNATKAVSLDEGSSFAHTTLSRVYSLQGEHDRAVTESEIAVELNPNSSLAYLSHAAALLWSGKTAEALPMLEMSIRLSPKDPYLWVRHAAMALCRYLLGDLTSAEMHARQALRGHMVAPHSYLLLAAALQAQGRLEEARGAIEQAREMRPDMSVGVLRRAFASMERHCLDKLLHDVEQAGLPQ